MATKIKWNEANFKWDLNPHLWNLAEIAEIVDSVTNGWLCRRHRASQVKGRQKRKSLIRLIMHRNGIKIYDEKKEVKNITHHTKEIELIAEELKRHVHIIH